MTTGRCAASPVGLSRHEQGPHLFITKRLAAHSELGVLADAETRMTKYLLTCGCGGTLPVDVGQAGERVSCQCGATLDVPPLRKLRHLPQAPSAAPENTATWNLRKGFIAACVTIAVILAAVALGSWLTEPTVPSFTAGRDQSVDEALKTITPVHAWRLWIELYRPLAERGFSDLVHSDTAAIRATIAKRRFLQMTLLSIAAVFLALALLTAFWPRGPTTRRGDKETRRAR
jgi:hypothetical protein